MASGRVMNTYDENIDFFIRRYVIIKQKAPNAQTQDQDNEKEKKSNHSMTYFEDDDEDDNSDELTNFLRSKDVTLDILFDEISTSIRLQIAFMFGVQTL